jgi:hypothetical protein
MPRFNAVAAVLLGAIGATQAQMESSMAECEAELVQLSEGMNSACCSSAANCASGSPTNCEPACASVFMPFYSHCKSFVASSLPELVKFGGKCEADGVSVSPNPPAGGATAGYVEAVCLLHKCTGSVSTGGLL